MPTAYVIRTINLREAASVEAEAVEATLPVTSPMAIHLVHPATATALISQRHRRTELHSHLRFQDLVATISSPSRHVEHGVVTFVRNQYQWRATIIRTLVLATLVDSMRCTGFRLSSPPCTT